MTQSSLPLFLRRTRALWRKLVPPSPKAPRAKPPKVRAPIHGFVDGCVAGEVRGWAMAPQEPGRRVHVVAVCDGRVVAETLADISRADLVQSGQGDGRHAFRLRLPPAMLDGPPRKVRIEAVIGGPRIPLIRGELEVTGLEPEDAGAPAQARPGARPGPSASVLGAPADAPLALVIWGSGGEAATRASAAAQAGPALQPIELDALRAQNGESARTRLEAAETVIFAKAGDVLDPALAGLLARARPLSDVVTWDGPGPAGRRPEARALGVLLGESLGGAFAVRSPALAAGGDRLMRALLDGDLGGFATLLAARPELRWAHLPAPLVRRRAAEDAPAAGASALTPPGYRRRGGGLAPDRVPDRWSLGLWPAWSDAAAQTLRSVLALAPPGVEIEVLVDAAGAGALRGETGLGAPQMSIRTVDVPAGDGAGAWMQALGAAATGDFVLFCQAGLALDGGAEALEDMAAWSQSPLVGAVTAEIRLPGDRVLAGLGAGRLGSGWAARSAYETRLTGRRRPVLAAPAALLGVGRSKLATLGGFDPSLGGAAADIGLALRLRRMNAASVLFGDLHGAWAGPAPPAGEAEGAALAAFAADELAAAADAYPAPGPDSAP